MTMQTLTSVEVKNRFGSVARVVNRGEPVTVTQYGEPTMMILPYEFAQEVLRAYRVKSITALMESVLLPLEDTEEMTLEEINAFVHENRP